MKLTLFILLLIAVLSFRPLALLTDAVSAKQARQTVSEFENVPFFDSGDEIEIGVESAKVCK